MHGKKRRVEEELALLLKRVCDQLLVDAQRADNGDSSTDVAAWMDIYNDASALCTRHVRRVVD